MNFCKRVVVDYKVIGQVSDTTPKEYFKFLTSYGQTVPHRRNEDARGKDLESIIEPGLKREGDRGQ